jgi:hypothetical protein
MLLCQIPYPGKEDRYGCDFLMYGANAEWSESVTPQDSSNHGNK